MYKNFWLILSQNKQSKAKSKLNNIKSKGKHFIRVKSKQLKPTKDPYMKMSKHKK
jgi:ElaB/YqjD/DUF883 family membrane-anchored ribosome-binding protein